MPKPIVVISMGLPKTPEDIDKTNECEAIVNLKKEYHVLFLYYARGIKFKFEVFYEKDFNKVKYEELKKIIKDGLK